MKAKRRQLIENLRKKKSQYNAINLKEKAEQEALQEIDDVPFRKTKISKKRVQGKKRSLKISKGYSKTPRGGSPIRYCSFEDFDQDLREEKWPKKKDILDL